MAKSHWHWQPAFQVTVGGLCRPGFRRGPATVTAVGTARQDPRRQPRRRTVESKARASDMDPRAGDRPGRRDFRLGGN